MEGKDGQWSYLDNVEATTQQIQTSTPVSLVVQTSKQRRRLRGLPVEWEQDLSSSGLHKDETNTPKLPLPKRSRKSNDHCTHQGAEDVSSADIATSSETEHRASKRVRKEKTWDDFHTAGFNRSSQKIDVASRKQKKHASKTRSTEEQVSENNTHHDSKCSLQIEENIYNQDSTENSHGQFDQSVSNNDVDDASLSGCTSKNINKNSNVITVNEEDCTKFTSAKNRQKLVHRANCAIVNDCRLEVNNTTVKDFVHENNESLTIEAQKSYQNKKQTVSKCLNESVDEFGSSPGSSKKDIIHQSDVVLASSDQKLKGTGRKQLRGAYSRQINETCTTVDEEIRTKATEESAALECRPCRGGKKKLQVACQEGKQTASASSSVASDVLVQVSERSSRRIRKSTSAILSDFDFSTKSPIRQQKSHIASSDTDEYEVPQGYSPNRSRHVSGQVRDGKERSARRGVASESKRKSKNKSSVVDIKSGLLSSDTDEYELSKSELVADSAVKSSQYANDGLGRKSKQLSKGGPVSSRVEDIEDTRALCDRAQHQCTESSLDKSGTELGLSLPSSSVVGQDMSISQKKGRKRLRDQPSGIKDLTQQSNLSTDQDGAAKVILAHFRLDCYKFLHVSCQYLVNS
jgi:hypothetical protein